jgi:NADH dehydrogenase
VALLEAGDEPLPHLDPKLRRIADARVEAERIEVRRNAKVVSVDEHGVGLSDGSRVEAATVVWAAGVKPNPLAGRIRGAETDEKGRLEVDPCLRVNGHDLVFALGDIAAASSGGRGVPPTAQAAVQEGAAVADNLVAELAGKTTAAFAYKQLGRFVDLGSRFAVSEVMGARISGRVAKLLWRAVYLYKLGDRRDRAAVLSDWILTRAGLRSVTRLPV